MGALACTRGRDIHLGPGQQRHLAHEAWHVVQQMQGRVRPTLQAAGLPVNADQRLEREADRMGARALAIGRSLPVAGPVSHFGGTAQDHGGGSAWQAAADVVQLASTNLRFERNVNGNSEIVASAHNRSSVLKTASDWVFLNGPYYSAPAKTVTNHSRGYEGMAKLILRRIHDQELVDACTYITKVYSFLEGKGKGIGAPLAKHKNELRAVVSNPTDDVNVDNIIDAFNYYLQKICDYPDNLFVWPEVTATEPDEPTGEYDNKKPTSDWVVNDTKISKTTRLTDELDRLKDARSDLVKALK